MFSSFVSWNKGSALARQLSPSASLSASARHSHKWILWLCSRSRATVATESGVIVGFGSA
ncbi:MAG: hypothetical protein II975_08705 [Bacteroidales bacterium]|nr:hypothetical protein [Bacteroidales bacterium]